MKIYNHNGRANACGEKIRAERERVHLSQEQLAAKLQLEGVNITQKAISRIETGERVVADYELAKIAKALDVSVLDMLGNM